MQELTANKKEENCTRKKLTFPTPFSARANMRLQERPARFNCNGKVLTVMSCLLRKKQVLVTLTFLCNPITQ